MAEDNAPKKSWLRDTFSRIAKYLLGAKTTESPTQTDTSVSPPTSPFSVDSKEASQASTIGSETASETSKNKSKSAREVLLESIVVARAKKEDLLAEESSRHQKEFKNAREQAKIIAEEKSKTSQTPLDRSIEGLVSKTEKLKGLVLGLQTSTTSLETPQEPQRLRGSETLIGPAIMPPAPPKKNTRTATSVPLSSEVGSILESLNIEIERKIKGLSTKETHTELEKITTSNFYNNLTFEEKSKLKQNFLSLPEDLQSASSKEQSNSLELSPLSTRTSSTTTSATTRAKSLTRAEKREPSANEYHGPELAQASRDYEERFNATSVKKTDNWMERRSRETESNGGPDSAIPTTLKDRNGEYKVVGGIRYYNLKIEDEKKDKVKDDRSPEQRSQDRATEIEAMQKRVKEDKAEYEKFNQQQQAKEAEQEVEIEHRKLVASKKPPGNFTWPQWPQSKEYFAHRSTDNYTIDMSPQNSAQRKPDPDSGLAERADQFRSQSGPTRWEDPAITHARNNAQALNTSHSAQTSKTSGARILTEDKENVPPGQKDPLETHYSKAFPSKTKIGFAKQVLARAITGGKGVEGGRGAGG